MVCGLLYNVKYQVVVTSCAVDPKEAIISSRYDPLSVGAHTELIPPEIVMLVPLAAMLPGPIAGLGADAWLENISRPSSSSRLHATDTREPCWDEALAKLAQGRARLASPVG